MYEELNKQFQYFIENQDKFVEKYNGRTIVLKNYKVIGVYDDEWDAVEEAQEKFEPGTYIVQRVTPGTEAYTVAISSNFVLASM